MIKQKNKVRPNHNDILDELKFIINPENRYMNSQKEMAQKVLNKLEKDMDWNPKDYVNILIDILENHYIFMKESLIGLIIIVVGCLVNWYFSFENEEENKE